MDDTDDGTDTPSRSSGRRSKVARLIDEYNLDGLGATLEARWTADGDERASLRDLADSFNRRLLDAALREAGNQPLDGEVANTYRLVTGDDVSAGDRTRAVRQLERDGVDVDALRDDFVSYQAIRTYLNRERDATYERQSRDPVADARQTIERLRGRTATVAENRLTSLVEDGEAAIGSPSVVVDVQVRCDGCGEQFALDAVLDGEYCRCSADDG